MAEILTKLVFEIETQTAKEIPLSPEELAQRELDIAAAEEARAAQEAERAALEAAKASAAAKLLAVGLTEEEIAALKG